MRLTAFLPPLLLPLALLSACGDEGEPVDADAPAATGEVLEGTINDAMLPLATVRSLPPLEEAADGEQQASGPAAPIRPYGEPQQAPSQAAPDGDGAPSEPAAGGEAAEEAAQEAP